MKTPISHEPKRDTVFYLGLILIALTLSMYLSATFSFDFSRQSMSNTLIANYVISVIYFFIILVSNIKKTARVCVRLNRYHYSCFLTLATISCFGLNYNMNIFDDFSTWVDVYLFIMYGGLLSTCFLDRLPHFIRVFVFFCLGLGTVMAGYFTIYLLPMMPFAIILCFVLGFSLHAIVPLLVLMNNITIFIKTEKSKASKTAYSLGIIAPLVLLLLFVQQWDHTANIIRDIQKASLHNVNNDLPNWVKISQQLSDGFFTQRIIKGDLVYTSSAGRWWTNTTGMTLTERKEHDPLITVAILFSEKINLSDLDRVSILKFYGQNRHDTHRKLWSGKDLKTTDVQTKIQVYPEYRFAYTEKIFTIANSNHKTQEALYTFQLPEGSVATSLSLWINGIEEQSRLTTRAKADNAYSQIVGVERRDPALMHWQEGNQLTVTVFPCTPREDRIFKIGITSPMLHYDEQLELPSISYLGPDDSNANTTTQVEFPTQPNMKHSWTFSGNLSCEALPISTHPFCFDNNMYWMDTYQPTLENYHPEFVYLDLNKSWSSSELEAVLDLYKTERVFICDQQQFIELNTIANPNKLLKKLLDQNFSLLPIHKIQYPERSLVISKSSKKSPNLSDLASTELGEGIKLLLQEKPQPIPLFSFSPQLSPYLQSLEEFYVFNYTHSTLDNLRKLYQKQQFPIMEPSSNAVVLHQANAVLYQQKNHQALASKAPNHLMRLFAYNQILKKIGTDYFSDDYINEELINIASKAHVVSPLSSLIVLETIEDYERFDIEEDKESLGNATKNNLQDAINSKSGAVPEPHEWAFIIILTLSIIFMQLKRWMS